MGCFIILFAFRPVVPNLFNVMDPFEDFPESYGPLK